MSRVGMVKTLALVALAAIGATAGCASSGPKVCTLVACEPGLAIDIHGDRGGDITVRIAAADGQQRSFECDAEARDCNAFFADYMPENVSVTVTKKEGNVIRSYGVTYRNTYPNGEDCPPVCKQGHIDLTL
jgi:hypothetical protein